MRGMTDPTPVPAALTPEQAAIATDAAAARPLLALVPIPDRQSYSSLTTYADCPYRYALRYLLKIPGPSVVAAFSFGTAAHAAFERFTRTRRKRRAEGGMLPTRQDLGRWFGEAWKTVEFPDEDSRAAYWLRAGPLLDAFWAIEEEGTAEVVGEERWFRLALAPAGAPPFTIGGAIDRIDRLPSGAVEVIDYKTGRPESQAPLEENLQLTIYALACRDGLGLGRPERLTLWFAESGERRSTARTDAQLDAARDEIAERVARMRTGELRATPSASACRWCDYRDLCPVRAPEPAGA